MIAQISIERIGLEGQGVGYDVDKNIYFVPGGLPGDQVEVEYAENARRYRDARLLRVVTPSPQRKTPVCEYFKKCGGCDWMDWEYAEQIQAKEKIVRHLLEKNQLMPERLMPMIAAEQSLGYRNRIQVRYEQGRLGFLARGTNSIVDIKSCAVADDRLNAELPAWREKLAAQTEPMKIELAVDEAGKVGSWVNQPHGAGGFGQVHSGQNKKLQAIVAERVKASGAKSVLELYCGNGNLTFAALDPVQRWMGIDSSTEAIGAANRRCSDKAKFLCGFVSPGLLSRLPAQWKNNYDLLLLDPPRQGITDLRPWIHDGVKTIIYISCSPLQFVKEVASLRNTFRVEEVQPIDMFPQTRHIELVATLTRVC